MDGVIHLAWRFYVAVPLMVLGVVIALWGDADIRHSSVPCAETPRIWSP